MVLPCKLINNSTRDKIIYIKNYKYNTNRKFLDVGYLLSLSISQPKPFLVEKVTQNYRSHHKIQLMTKLVSIS